MRVLVVDDDAEQRARVVSLVSSQGHEVESAENGLVGLEKFAAFSPAVIITDLRMPKLDGLGMMRQLRSEGRLPPTIVLTAFASVDIAISAIHELGAFWFLEKPVHARTLQLLLQQAGTHSKLQEEVHELRRELSFRGAIGEMVGESAPMLEMFGLIRQIAHTDVSVLITGESGTGKELVARAIHSLGRRGSHPFVAINCAALPETLIESEIFGHEKGSFTGAVERRAGCLESAKGGTLFLDEIGEMPLAMQAKLLRVLEDFKFRRLGGTQELTADVRVLAATNREPKQAIKDGKLREDLYYRLSVFHIEIPPLRRRLDDLPVLIQHLIEKLNAKHGTKVTDASPDVYARCAEWEWKGNVRELRNVIERAVILAGEGTLQLNHLLRDPMLTGGSSAVSSETGGLGVRVGSTIDQAERVLIEATVAHTKNNKTRAAQILGITTKTLHFKLRQYQLDGAGEAETSSEAAIV